MDDTTIQHQILIVEDDPKLASVIESTLRFAGLQTQIVHNGADAIQSARANPPDVILLDMMLPNMSGLEVCQTLKNDPLTASVRIIFLTGKAEQDDIIAGITAGADEYLTKPFSPTELIDLINEALAGEFLVPQKRRYEMTEIRPDQMSIYAQELRELFEKERAERTGPGSCAR